MTLVSPTVLSTPLRFASDMEAPREDEAETVSEIVAILRRIMGRDGGGRVERPLFPSGHGLVRGEMAIIENLHPALRQGLFAEPSIYPVLLRFSSQFGALCRNRPASRGLGIKVVGVDGERLPGTEGQRTQDFVLADAPAFHVPDAQALLEELRRVAGEPLAPGEAASAALANPGAPGVEAHILSSVFHSQVPILYGPYVAKLRFAPVGSDLLSLGQEAIEARNRPDALREAVADFFESQTATFELSVQLMTDRERMPIEDASAVWPEAESPYCPVARITVPPQAVLDGDEAESAEDGLAFSPWFGLAAHRPLGSIMRARRPAYAMSASLRAARNGCPIHDPRTEADLPI